MTNTTETVWTPGKWLGKNFPQRVKLVKGESTLIGVLTMRGDASTYFDKYMLKLDGIAQEIQVQSPGAWTLYVEEEVPCVPTEPGAYLDKNSDLWVLSVECKWSEFTSGVGHPYQMRPKLYLPMTPIAHKSWENL